MAWPLVVGIALFTARSFAQELVYAVSFVETPGSLHARFPTGAMGAPIESRLAMLRQTRKTEIYSASMTDDDRSLLFSDENMNLELSQVGSVSRGKNAYIEGIEREWRSGPAPGAYSTPRSVYQLTLDGSRKFHRLWETQPNQSRPVPSSDGSRVAFQNFVGDKYVISIYDVSKSTLIQQWELTKILQAHCVSCIPLSLGWLADGHRLFVNLVEGDDDGEETSGPAIPGTYLVSEDGKDLGKLSAQYDYLLRQLPEGTFAFLAHLTMADHPGKPQPFIVLRKPENEVHVQLPAEPRPDTIFLSPSGRYLAYIEGRTTPRYQTELHLWVQDLEGGGRRELFVAPPANPPSSPQPNLTVTILGWIDN